MATGEEFDFSSDEENFENDWKYDENNDLSLGINVSSTLPSSDSNTSTKTGSSEVLSEQNVSRMDLNTTKAGMEGLDKEKINQIIHEASKGSRFYENEKKKEKQVQKRIGELQRKMASFSDGQKLKAKQSADKIVEELEQGRDLSRTIVHIDMDAFYAAVEMRDEPSLKSKPMAVGGSAMLCTSNYLARRYGVRAGMPGFIAKKLCPSLTIVPTNFDKYTKISHEIRDVLAKYDRNFLPMSLDEAYLDITEYLISIEERKIQGTDEVKNEGTGEIERKADAGSSDLGVFEGVKASMRTDQYGTIGRKHLKGEIQTVIKQEPGLIEAISNSDYKQVTVQANVTTIDFGECKCDGHNSAHHKMEEINISSTTKMHGSVGDSEHDLNENHDKTSLRHEVEESANSNEMFYRKVEEVVKEMRRKIEERTKLTASAGIAPNMFLAKVCSDKNKPNGQFYLKPERDKIMDFVRELPLRKAFGIGRVSEQILTSVLTVNTCSELHDRRDLMQLLFTPISCRNYLEISLGLGSTVVDVDRERKSMSTETTFKEINKPEELFAKCRELCQELSDSLKEHGLTTRKVGIKLKTINFEVKTRVSTSSYPVQEAREIFSHAKKLLVNEIRSCSPQPLRLRLMGIRAAELCQKRSAGESQQQNILTLMKRYESVHVPTSSPNLNSSGAAGPVMTCSSQKDEGGLKCEREKTEISQYFKDALLSEKQPNMSKQLEYEQSFLQAEHDNLDRDIKMGEVGSVNQHVSEKEPITYNCPVCGRDLTFSSGNTLLKLNQHIDKCLSQRADRDISQNDSIAQTKYGHPTSKKRKRESSNKSIKRRPMDRFLTKQ